MLSFLRRALACGFLLWIVAGVPALADDDPYFAKGFTAYQAGDYAGAFAAFSEGRAAGQRSSTRNLGVLYVYGRGTIRDVQKAHDLFLEAWDKGDAAAGYLLGWMYDGKVQDWPADFQQALHWFRLGGERGDIQAQDSLGCYLTGGVAGVLDEEGAH